MPYQLLLLDIDGTLRPRSVPRTPPENARAVQAVQRAGVKVALATGRGYGSVPRGLLRGIRPDFWLCAAGAQLLDAQGTTLAANRMTPEEMYALVDFFENYELALRFSFTDGSYAYLGYETFAARQCAAGLDVALHDGEDQDHHLVEMPFGAYGYLSAADVERFQAQYGYLGLRFLQESEGAYDILRPGVDKAAGLETLLAHTGLAAADCVAIGDGANDAAMLRAAGLGIAVADGAEAARTAADRVGPAADPDGVAQILAELWPQAFAP